MDRRQPFPVNGSGTKRPTIGLRLRSIGYQPPGFAAVLNGQTAPTNANQRTNDDSPDPYLLRGLIWCALCDQPMAALQGPDRRLYGCPNRECPRPLVPAATVEDATWRRFAELYGVLAEGVPAGCQQAVLRQVLSRTLVGADTDDLAFTWRA